MKATAFFLFCGIVLFTACNPARKYSEQPVNTLQGVLLKKPWSKSTQSYCAQGSDYWVLKEGEEEHVLAWLDEDLLTSAAFKEGKEVKLKGVWTQKKISPPENVISQHPVGPDGDDTFECVVFSVLNMK